MKHNDIAKLVNDLRDVAITYAHTQQLRQRISDLVVPLSDELERLHKISSELEDTLKEGIRYDEKYGAYVLCWTQKQLDEAKAEAAEIIAALNNSR